MATTAPVAPEPPVAALPRPAVAEASEPAAEASEPAVAEAPVRSGPTRREPTGPSDQAVAFDVVMARVTSIIDAAASRSARQADTPSSAQTERPRSRPFVAVDTLVSPASGAEPSAVAVPEAESDISDAPDRDVTAKYVTEDVVTEDHATEDVVTEDVVTEDVVTEKAVTGDGVKQDVVEEDVATRDSVTEEIASKPALFGTAIAPTANGASEHAPPHRPKPKVPLSNEAAIMALRRTGLGDDIVGPVSEGLRRGGDLETLLLGAFGRITAAPTPPRRAGSLLAVVGAGREARRLAAAVADEIGADPQEVVLASLDARFPTPAAAGRHLRTTVEAAERAPGWRRSQPAVVVVEAPISGAVRSWACHLIAALRPTAVWGVVDATHKIEDIASWATGLGGLDALAVENVATTVSPGTALAVGIPVARLDGRSATAQCWAATIVDAVNSIDPTDLPQPGRGGL